MYTRVLFLALALLSGQTVIASDKSDVVAVVHKWVDGFNKGDSKSALANCADESAIIDDFPPYVWHGVGACNTWFNDINVWFKQQDGAFDHATIDKVNHVQVTGDHAYIVLSATFYWKEKDTPKSERGISTWGMKKDDRGWRITGWTWTTT